MVEKDTIENVKLEKRILMNVKNDFLVKISFVFQTATKVFFVMDFARGGELYQHWK